MTYSLTTRTLKKNTYRFEEALSKDTVPESRTDIACAELQRADQKTENVPKIDPDANKQVKNNPEQETAIMASCNTCSSSASIYEEQKETQDYIFPEPEVSRRQGKKHFKNVAIFEEEEESTDDIILKKLNEDGYYDEILPSDEDIKFEKPKKAVELWKYVAVAALFLASVTTIAVNLVKIIK